MEHLTVIIDICNDELKISTLMQSVLVFLHSFISVSSSHTVSLIAAARTCKILYPSSKSSYSISQNDGQYWPLKEIDDLTMKNLRQFATALQKDDLYNCNYPVALSTALCYISKKNVPGRILVVSGKSEEANYVATMNCIFASQKLHVPIDVLALRSGCSAFLQQASVVTKGVFRTLRPGEPILSLLLSTYLPTLTLRKDINFVSESNVDFRAACFCHRRVQSIGYVCSVCLGIFCEKSEECATCGTIFT